LSGTTTHLKILGTRLCLSSNQKKDSGTRYFLIVLIGVNGIPCQLG